MYAFNNNVIYFNSFGVEHIPKEIQNLLVIKRLRDLRSQKNIFRIQVYDAVMCGYFCIGFIDFMLDGKSLTDVTNLISANSLKKNDDIILNYFKNG